MKLKAFLKNKINELLEKHRVVVWYDSTGDFKGFVGDFNAPGCVVLSTEESILRTRREADRIYRLMLESDRPDESEVKMLIYNPVNRGVGDEARRRDPFEVYAVIGTAFGDTEDQTLASLARQAMPEMAAEINRLFNESKPDLDLLDGLEEGLKYPLLMELLGTETPAEILALTLCDDQKAAAVDEKPGCALELLRLFESSIGYKTPDNKCTWKENRKFAAAYVLFSEFAYKLGNELPEELTSVACAEKEAADIIRAACERMRSDFALEAAYTDLAEKVEKDLYLAEVVGDKYVPGGRDTFPFEERFMLGKTVENIVNKKYENALKAIKGREKSIWRRDPQKEADWIVLDRAVGLLKTAENIKERLGGSGRLGDMVKLYAEHWSDLDRDQRLFENAVTASPSKEVLAEIVGLCRNTYRNLVVDIQGKFLEAVTGEGWPPEGVLSQTRIFNEFVSPAMERREKTAYFLVDALRYEMGRDLGDSLKHLGEVKTTCAAGVVPTVTDYGMAALLPGAEGRLRLANVDGKLVPALGDKLLPGSKERMNMLQEQYGDRLFETTFDELQGSFQSYKTKLKTVDLLVVRTQDPDIIAENLGNWRANKYLSGIVGEISAFIKTLMAEGFSYIVVTADHGHLIFAEIPPGDVVQEPPGEWMRNKRRCRLGRRLADSTGVVTYKAEHLGISGDVEDFCMPTSLKVFSAGSGYFHGGLSLQEAVIPVVVLRAEDGGEVLTGKPEIEIRYREDRFTSRVIGLRICMRGNLFKPTEEVLLEVYDGTGSKARLVGEAADCEARDAKTGLVTVQGEQEIQVPVLIEPDFAGEKVEIRVVDPITRAVWAKKVLINDMLD